MSTDTEGEDMFDQYEASSVVPVHSVLWILILEKLQIPFNHK